MTHSFPSMPLLPPSATHLASEEAHALMRANLHAHGVDFVTNDATGRRLELASVHDLTLDDTLCLALVHRIGEDVGPLVVSTTLSGRLRLHRPFGWVPVDSLIAAWNAARRAARPRHALIELVRLRYEATWFDVPRVMG